MITLAGHCHCGAIRVELATGKPAMELPLRSCGCGFCRRHGAMTTGDRDCRLDIEAAPGSLNRYRFGRGKAEALLCDECGVYVASVIEIENTMLATLNVTGVALDGFSGRAGDPVAYDDETDEDRLARRKACWTPTVLVEASPSA